MAFIIHLLVTALLMLVISRMPVGIKIQSFPVALLAALVFGLVNALVKPIVFILSLPVTIITFGLFIFVINAFMFWLAAWLVPGFKTSGFVSCLLGSLLLTVFQTIVYMIFPQIRS